MQLTLTPQVRGAQQHPATRSTLSDVSQAGPSSSGPQDHHAFRRGIEQFNSGHFFDAHETWEAIWLASPEPEKTFLQGIIQVTAAFHHYSRGNIRGTRNLLEAGLTRMSHFPDAHRGIALDALRTEAQAWATILAAGQIPDSTFALPQIKFIANG